MKSKQAENIRIVVQYFSGKNSILGPNLSQLCLEFSGNLRVGKKSLCYITYRLPAFRGKLFKPIRVSHFRGEQHPKNFENGTILI